MGAVRRSVATARRGSALARLKVALPNWDEPSQAKPRKSRGFRRGSAQSRLKPVSHPKKEGRSRRDRKLTVPLPVLLR